MLPVRNVELTKVHYFDASRHHRNIEVPTVSREVFQNTFNRNLIIKKNVFGHKWVLKINEHDEGDIKKSRTVKCLVYCIVFSSILLAIASGAFFAFELEKKLFNNSLCNFGNQSISTAVRSTEDILKNIGKHVDQNAEESFSTLGLNLRKVNETVAEKFTNDSSSSTEGASGISYCTNCTENHVCFKTEETEKPKCVEISDKHDPTGCGGLCILNIEFCAILDRQRKVYECSPLKNLLKCPEDTFNCGEQCIARSKVCDGIIHCTNMQDERFCDCNLKENFQCTNSTKCLPKSKKCDGIVDCWDRSDENLCHEGCPPQHYSCLNGQCITQEYFCDGIAHCLDSSDEPQGCSL
ncbi:sortilin-related receptor-like [Harmonia axyridis]|uniref:sortilin-related receptor-like n=1 Tax=Harmonia axyridis TaxID=115357 RepID=UPI001E2758E8|nr:sortilin-related receptor-like [Harmonia axyridis]